MARFGPWRREMTLPLQALQTELNRMFDEYWNPSRFTSDHASPMDMEPASWTPAVDLVETADACVLSVEVPGVDPASIDLSVTGNVLTLRGIKPNDESTEPGGPLRERRFGPFHRQVILTGDVNFDAVQADARNGVLKVRIPKKETVKARTIPVQTA
ncbi:MAG: Hsp20/alpha crystallin family protein [Isosphaeraceae bacterium]